MNYAIFCYREDYKCLELCIGQIRRADPDCRIFLFDDGSAPLHRGHIPNPEDVAALLDAVETHIFQIRECSNNKQDGKSLAHIVREAVAAFEQFIATRGQIQGLSTGFDQLDKKSNGLKPGDMFVVAARPSMGKTSFLLNIIEHISLNEKKPTLLFSCEMPAVQIAERLLFARSGVRRGDIVRRGTLTQLEMQHFKKAVADLGAAQLVIDDTAAISINELRAKARRVMRDLGGLAAIGVDYLQLMRSHSKQAANSREREVAEISAGLKALAKELKVPVIVLKFPVSSVLVAVSWHVWRMPDLLSVFVQLPS